jgi:general secretion pathway protein G
MKKTTRQSGNEARRWERRNVGTGDCQRQRARALTLVELMVVIVILGILATTATLTVRDHLVTGKQSAAKQEMAQVTAALELFYLENDRYPTNEEGLAVLVQHTEKHPDGWLKGGSLKDPWGHAYQYVYPGLHGTFDLVCFGADGREGGRGADVDIVSWELK